MYGRCFKELPQDIHCSSVGWVNLTIKVVVDYIYLNLTLNHIIIQFSMIISLGPKLNLDLGFGDWRAVVGWSKKIKFMDP